MVEFGARLSLHDGMSGVLVKAIQKQREFREQIDRTREALDKVSEKKHDIQVNGSAAQKEADKIKDKLEELEGNTVASVTADTDPAQSELSTIREKLDEIKRNPVRMRIEANVQEAKRRLAEMKAKLDPR